MRRKLEMRKSALQLIGLDRSGRVDSRSEIGSVVCIDEWAKRPEAHMHCKCEQIRDNEQIIPSHLMVTDQYLYVLRNTDKEGKLVIKTRRKLSSIMKITTKAKMADVVKLQYGSKGSDGVVHITDSDRLHIPKHAGTVIKTIKSILQPDTVNAISPRRASTVGIGLSDVNEERALSARRPSVLSDSVLAHSPYKSIRQAKELAHSPVYESDHE